jgi:tungstate transport system ATP-binding protein
VSGPIPLFEARNVQVSRGGSLILDVPSLVIEEGEVFFLIGPNGAGKSTLLQVLSGLLKPSRGEILFRGRQIGTEIPLLLHRRRLAMVLQEPLLFDTTVYQNVASGLKIRGLKRREVEPTVGRALERFAIAHLRDRSARTLSGGEARRVSLARALATEPEVLLLDEPFSALDPVIRETLIVDLEGVLRETRITTLFVTHDRTEAFRLGSRIGVMKTGEILQTGSPVEVMNHPVDGFVASLVGLENVISGEVARRSGGHIVITVSGKELQTDEDLPPGERVTLCIRPEKVTLSATGPEGSKDGVNRLRGRVERVVPAGPYQKISLDCGFGLVAYVTNHALLSFPMKRGDETFASFSATDVHVIRSR